MLYQVIVLVCASHFAHAECSHATAHDVIVVPERQSLMTCSLHGQAYVATTALSLDGTSIKILCVPQARRTLAQQ